MNIRTFDLERIQSLYENTVPFNLTESGFHPFTLKELLTPDQIEELNNVVLGYGQTNGSELLRRRIADLYKGLDESNVLVTNGSSEANFVACHSLLNSSDELVMMLPNYMQIWGIAEEIGVVPKSFQLKDEASWAPDLDELKSRVNNRTKMIALCNPNNPTGYILSRNEMETVVEIADRVGAWIYCDEVYRGAELNGDETTSFIGLYDKVMVTGGLSKAYALPGLRLGWLVSDAHAISSTWSYHDYTSIASGMLSQKVAEYVLEKDKREEIVQRNRAMLRNNLGLLENWLLPWEKHLNFSPPRGGGMAFMSYKMDINSSVLSERLRKEFGLFIAAGDWFGMDYFIRLGIGAKEEYLKEGLTILAKGLKQICQL